MRDIEGKKIMEVLNELEDFMINGKKCCEYIINPPSSSSESNAVFLWVKDKKADEREIVDLTFPGVYFIYVGDELYYIGESYNIFLRMKENLGNNSELFSEEVDKNNISVKVIETKKGDHLYRLAIEGAAYIIARESEKIKKHENLCKFRKKTQE